MLTSAKLIRHFKKLFLMSSTNSFQYVPSSIAILHIVQNLRVVHFWPLLQIKYATPDDPTKIGLTSQGRSKPKILRGAASKASGSRNWGTGGVRSPCWGLRWSPEAEPLFTFWSLSFALSVAFYALFYTKKLQIESPGK